MIFSRTLKKVLGRKKIVQDKNLSLEETLKLIESIDAQTTNIPLVTPLYLKEPRKQATNYTTGKQLVSRLKKDFLLLEPSSKWVCHYKAYKDRAGYEEHYIDLELKSSPRGSVLLSALTMEPGLPYETIRKATITFYAKEK